MTNSHNSVNTGVDSPDITIVLAGTIASGKTTLLWALSVYEDIESRVAVRLLGADTKKIRNNARNCFNVSDGSREIGEDPWPEATIPEKEVKKFRFQIDSPKINPRIFFSDFAGETFLDAYDLADEQAKKALLSNAETEIKDKIGANFRSQISNADIVIIVVSAKDVIDFPDLLAFERKSAERMQFAYSLMAEKSNGLANENVEILFVVTQCDQYKSLLNKDKKRFEDGLKDLTGGAAIEAKRIIYTSSAFQTEIKKIGEAEILKFCPVPASRRQSGQPLMLGINTLVRKICQVALKVAAKRRHEEEIKNREKEEAEKRRKEAEEKKKREMKDTINRFVRSAKEMVKRAEEILAKPPRNRRDSVSYLSKEKEDLKVVLSGFENFERLDDISELRKLHEQCSADSSTSAVRHLKRRIESLYH